MPSYLHGWSSDDKYMCYCAERGGEYDIYEIDVKSGKEERLMNADGTDIKTIVKLFGGQGTINVNSWSPDSRKFAFVSYIKH